MEFCFELLQATTMLLYALSGIETNRKVHQIAPGVSCPISLPGLPGLCLSPCLTGPADEDLYGPKGIASRVLYKGWIVEVYGIWENNYRNKIKEAFEGDRLIRPEIKALGDLRYIRNDLLHTEAGVASAERTGKCEVLNWFEPGDRITLEIRHVLDFLNQVGALSPAVFNSRCAHTWSICHNKQTLIDWKPEPKLVSVRTGDGPNCQSIRCKHRF